MAIAERELAAEDNLRATDRSEVLAVRLRESIESGRLRPGDRLMPIRRLAADHGLSFNAARLVVRRLERVGLLESRQRCGTFVCEVLPPSRTEAGRNGRVVSLFFERQRAHVYGPLVTELIDRLHQQGLDPMQHGFDPQRGVDQYARILECWRQGAPRAIFVQRRLPGLDEAIERVSGGRTRIVAIYRPVVLNPSWDRVTVDMVRAGALAGEYLLGRGHRRIGLVTHGRRIHAAEPHHERKRNVGHTPLIIGLGRYLRETGLHHGLSVHYNRWDPADWQSEKGANPFAPSNMERMRVWLGGANRPTAVFGSDYRMAAVRRVAESLGLQVGRDLELLGLGDTPWSKALGLSSINLRVSLVAEHLMRIIADDSDASEATHYQIVVPPKLTIR